MQTCPYCNSENTYYSKKRCVWVCEDCDNTFSENDILKLEPSASDSGIKLFFSYGHDRNSEMVERIRKDLEVRGHHVWIDTDKIRRGDFWREDVLNGVLNSSKIIAFLSEHSTRIPGVCLDELRIAICVRGAIIKTVLLESENHIQPPSTISGIQWLDMSEWRDKKTNTQDFETWYKKKFEELCEVIESDNSKELDGEIHSLKGSLCPNLNTDKEYNLLKKDFYGREWLNEYIDRWLEKGSSKSLIVYGKPGSGKSAFCVNYSHYNSKVYGCFLCEWNRGQTKDPNDLIRTIAFRLATKLEDYRHFLLHIIQEHNNNLKEMNPEELFEFLLVYPLNNLVDGERETGLIIVDGLDEAENSGENPLAMIFSLCVQKLPRWIRFIFTSRPETNVSIHFLSSQSIDIVEDMPIGFNDILKYLMNALKTELNKFPRKLDVLNKICEQSEGTFLYATLLVDEIKNNTIDLYNVDTFPKGLNDFYLCSMKRIFKKEEDFKPMRSFIELFCVADTIPEYIILSIFDYTKYDFLLNLDKIGAWIVCTNIEGRPSIGFCHKSVKDWFTNYSQSGDFFVDSKIGALKLAHFCEKNLHGNYERAHVCDFFIEAEAYEELESFMIQHADEMYPYWLKWRHFPNNWNHQQLLEIFWTSSNRNDFLKKLQKEGDTELALWIFGKVRKKYGLENFDRDLISIYIDIIHLSGKYSEAVDIIDQYLKEKSISQIVNDEFLLMLKIRRLHHSAFFTPIGHLLQEAVELYSLIDDSHPKAINELLMFIGGKKALINEWEESIKWLNKSKSFAKKNNLETFYKRSIRRICEYYFYKNDVETALKTIPRCILSKEKIQSRYDAYLYCTLANIYTSLKDKEDEAMQYYKDALLYFSSKGISGWIAHSYLGIANVNFKIKNYEESYNYACRANEIYKEIGQDWGIIMSGALLSAYENSVAHTAPLRVLCKGSIKRALQMQFNSCISTIEDLCDGNTNYLKLYFV